MAEVCVLSLGLLYARAVGHEVSRQAVHQMLVVHFHFQKEKNRNVLERA